MLSDYEREECRNYMKMQEARKTLQGQVATRLANAKQSEQEERERIIKLYSEQPEPPVWAEQKKLINPILQCCVND